MDKKSILIILILALIVTSVILVINYVQRNGNTNEKVIQCIAKNSQLIVKEGCPACASQKTILKDYLNKFKIIDCAYDAQKCMDLGITHVPTWIIKGEKYEGAHTIEKLKELTGC